MAAEGFLLADSPRQGTRTPQPLGGPPMHPTAAGRPWAGRGGFSSRFFLPRSRPLAVGGEPSPQVMVSAGYGG